MPWPPVSVMEPTTRPIRFCTTMKQETITSSTTSGLPPSFRRVKSALRPIEAKNISMKVVCSSVLNLNFRPSATLSP